jgi:hypothetical protein
LAFLILIGCSPFWAKVKLSLSLAYYRITAFLIHILKSAKLQLLIQTQEIILHYIQGKLQPYLKQP